jgi:hypothetical protein
MKTMRIRLLPFSISLLFLSLSLGVISACNGLVGAIACGSGGACSTGSDPNPPKCYSTNFSQINNFAISYKGSKIYDFINDGCTDVYSDRDLINENESLLNYPTYEGTFDFNGGERVVVSPLYDLIELRPEDFNPFWTILIKVQDSTTTLFAPSSSSTASVSGTVIGLVSNIAPTFKFQSIQAGDYTVTAKSIDPSQFPAYYLGIYDDFMIAEKANCLASSPSDADSCTIQRLKDGKSSTEQGCYLSTQTYSGNGFELYHNGTLVDSIGSSDIESYYYSDKSELRAGQNDCNADFIDVDTPNHIIKTIFEDNWVPLGSYTDPAYVVPVHSFGIETTDTPPKHIDLRATESVSTDQSIIPSIYQISTTSALPLVAVYGFNPVTPTQYTTASGDYTLVVK